MDKFVLELTKEDAKHLMRCLMQTHAKGKDLDIGITVEEKIFEFLKKCE